MPHVTFRNTGTTQQIEVEEEDQVTMIPTVSEITFHKLYEFGKLFERNKLGLDLLENSFSPELNQS